MRPSFIEVNLDHLEHNLALIRKHTNNKPVMAVVKSNAYGHGILEIAKFFEKLKVHSLGVALLEEGIFLREKGINLPIVVFGGVIRNQISQYLDWELEFFVSSIDVLRITEKICKAISKKATVHLKIDSGMGRIGEMTSRSGKFFKEAVKKKHIKIKGVCSHLACADDPTNPMTIRQVNSFLSAISVFDRFGLEVPLRHIANSGGVLYFPESHLDMVRPGILLYGVYPEKTSPRILDVKPALKLKSQVSFHKSIPKGFSVSYGAAWIADKDTEISTIPLGYGDGFLSHLSNRGKVLIRGKRRSIIGRVCMDQFMVSCESDCSKNGDEVVLIGQQENQSIKVEEISEWAGTIPYEILTNLNQRIPRIYKN